MGEIGGVQAPGAMPTDPDEVAGVIPGQITLQRHLIEWEASNFLEGQKIPNEKLLSEDFVRVLHERLFPHDMAMSGHVSPDRSGLRLT